LIRDKRDESGLKYMRNRYYDARTGRFTQEDPIGLAGGMNLYGFAGGDPVNYSDPFGLCPQWLDGTPCTLQDGANFAAGFGDALSLGLTSIVRQVTPGGDGVDYGSGQYTTGVLAGALIDVIGGAVVGSSHGGGGAEVGSAGGPRAGKAFTPAGKRAVIEANEAANGGAATCKMCGIKTVPAQQSKRGVTPPKNETHVDHIIRRRDGGDGSPSNGQVLCRDCNVRVKGDD
jgi:RHS repeat-associated protein